MGSGGTRAQFDSTTFTAREDITEEVTPAGDYAIEIGHYSFEGTSKIDKTPRSGAGRYMVLWRKDADGAWRLLRDIGSEVPPKKP
jgi:ketosteroid isomerase-like protein